MINCLIIDDEPIAIGILEDYVKRTPFLSLKGSCSGATEAMKLMSSGKIDLIFLDIQMPDLTGIEFSKILGDKVKVIFTTAFEQYAVEGFKVNAIGYLLKPFSYPEFIETVNRAKEWFDLSSASKTSLPAADSLFVKSEYKIIKVSFNEILYIEGLKDYVKFYVEGQTRPVMSLMSLKSLEENLPSDQFMRVHRSFIVNLNKIKTIQRNEILFGDVIIPVADSYKDAFQGFVRSKFLE